MVGVKKGEWLQVTNYKVCMTRRCWGGISAHCALRGLVRWLRWWGGKYLLLIGLKKAVGRASWAVDLGILGW